MSPADGGTISVHRSGHSDRMLQVWGRMPFNVKKILVATLLVMALPATGCSDGITKMSSQGSAGATSEPTPSASASPTSGPETTVDTGNLEGDLGKQPEILLRVEGDSGVTFSGLCSVGEEETVLGGGQVPKRYGFDPRGERLSCRIQKQDQGDGDLKVTLLAGDSTHSVQQINTPGSAIDVSYEGG